MLHSDQGAVTQDERALDDVLQLADVPRERVVQQDRQRLVGQPLDIVSEKNGIQFGFSPSPGIAPAWFDARGLHTCLANLVSNAFEACKLSGRAPTGVLHSALQSGSPAPRAGCSIALRVVDATDCVVFEVEDAGCGMDTATQNALFRGIFTTKGPSGTGLGLVMTHKIVQDHGGTITVRSAPGQGSLFRIALPRVAPTTTR